VQALVQFVSQYDPAFSDRIRGATDEEIDVLEGLVGRPLPASYRDFLRMMGHSDGDLDLAFDGTTDILDVIDYYREFAEGEVFPPPAGCILIGTGDPAAGDVYLQGTGPEEPAVLLGVDGRIQQTYGDSWPKVIHRRAFIKYELERLSFSCFYADPEMRDLVTLAREAAAEQGFEALWFSDSVAYCARRGRVVLIVERYQRSRGTLKVAGETREDVEQSGLLFSSRLGVQFRQWWKAG
jgi:hypothetical protein